MDQKLKEKREEIRAAFGTMPPDDAEKMDRVLHSLEEEPPMKKKAISGVALVALLALLLAGAALAIANNYGVLDFLRGSRETGTIDPSNIQTEFVQSGGDLENVSIRVRDAVTDGITLLLTIEMKSKDPDVMLMDSSDHSTLFQKAQGNYFGPDTGRIRNEPDWASFPDEQPYVFVSAPTMARNEDRSYVNPLAFTIGAESYYEDAYTLVHTMIYDITRLEDPGDVLTLPISMAEAYVAEVTDTDRDGITHSYQMQRWEYSDETRLDVEVRLVPMETRVMRPKGGADIHVGHVIHSDVTFTFSPYMMYMESNFERSEAEPDPATLVTLPPEEISADGMIAARDELGRLYWQMHYVYVLSKTEQENPPERDRTLFSSNGLPYPEQMIMRGFYQVGSDQAYETVVDLEEVR